MILLEIVIRSFIPVIVVGIHIHIHLDRSTADEILEDVNSPRRSWYF